jgi:hypothetical protein
MRIRSRFARISISALAKDRQRVVCHSASYFNGQHSNGFD